MINIEIFRADTRIQCNIVGGSVEQNLEGCLYGDNLWGGCDSFLEKDCQYTGTEMMTQEMDGPSYCEEFCLALSSSVSKIPYILFSILV